MKKWLVSLGILLLVALLGFSIWAYAHVRDRHPGYSVDLDIRQSAPAPLKAGFAALTITPEIVDTWSDKNDDAVFNEEDGDNFHDNNHNGRFDAVWIAGFGNARAANGVHDELWARCMVIDDGRTGIALIALDAIGGLMTTDADFKVEDPFTDERYITPSFEKIRAQGEQLALLSLRLLRGADVTTIEQASIGLRATTIELPLDNTRFKLAAFLGILDHGLSGWMKLRSEVAAWNLDTMSFVCIPGEIYPEIIEGGIESPPGQDFQTKAVEVPPIRAKMSGRYKFVLGLANDEIGYIIPKSEWDVSSPYLFLADKSPYGEINSLGPETAPILHQNLITLLNELSRK